MLILTQVLFAILAESRGALSTYIKPQMAHFD